MSAAEEGPSVTQQDVSIYDFQLPRELIAQHPLPVRSDARLMLVERSSGQISHHHVRDLPELLMAGDSLVVNDSRVIAARLVGYRAATGGRWEGLYLRSEAGGLGELLSQTRGKLQPGERITLRDLQGREQEQLEFVTRLEQGHVAMRPLGDRSWPEVLESCGRVPLPPYIRDGCMVDQDRQRYQTVYARRDGSVAAPTAGLHLTEELIERLRKAGQRLLPVTLHVGLGTFRPISADRLDEHKMHSEWGELTPAVATRLAQTRQQGGRIIAVGTTSLRVLESAAAQPDWLASGWSGDTDLFIQPGYRFQAIDGLLTNFHLPRSSLLVLVAALAGRELILQAYREAVEQQYRFYSYGDCMLIL
jgi:S-adenosylmethionine:tRNA ribosyltransferase-isomerase